MFCQSIETGWKFFNSGTKYSWTTSIASCRKGVTRAQSVVTLVRRLMYLQYNIQQIAVNMYNTE